MNPLTLNPIFQSGMVLQRDKPILIFGTAPAGCRITVRLFSKDTDCTASVTPDRDTWQCTLPPHRAGEHFTLSASCYEQMTDSTACSKAEQKTTDSNSQKGKTAGCTDILLTDISIGDIWLACGQSNMEFFLRYDADWETVKNYEKNPHIHMYNVPQLAFPGHSKNTTGYGKWFCEGETGFETFSAPGYSFARNIQPHIGVPVGIIGCSWGGTTASAWLDESCLEKEPLSIYLKEYKEAVAQYSPEEMTRISLEAWAFEDSAEHTRDFMPLLYGRDRKWQEDYMKEHASDPIIPMGPYSINRPGGLYHQMLEPLIPFSIKGVLWYQGESDACHAEMYDQLLTSLISFWRKKWHDDFPFLFVQLAPFGVWLECDSSHYTEVRARQELVSQTIPNTGMISIMDIGSYYDIHPKQKMEVGRRLALLARGKVYREDILCESPALSHAKRKGDTITLTLSHAAGLHGDPLPSFVILQDGQECLIDHIMVQDHQIILQVKALSPSPCTVQFAWADFVEVHIWNEAGLPVRPFCCEV
ncbi:MAG: sialate O-acetylesterase [Clostridiales bacterium]|nr:sialate O-acetylesterase [Clostridiales bacterium]